MPSAFDVLLGNRDKSAGPRRPSRPPRISPKWALGFETPAQPPHNPRTTPVLSPHSPPPQVSTFSVGQGVAILGCLFCLFVLIPCPLEEACP